MADGGVLGLQELTESHGHLLAVTVVLGQVVGQVVEWSGHHLEMLREVFILKELENVIGRWVRHRVILTLTLTVVK